jgi:hypothetical protein
VIFRGSNSPFTWCWLTYRIFAIQNGERQLIKRITHTLLSGLLAVLLVFGTTAKEYIHLFTHHQDTVHTHHDGLSFENEHHHCTFLSFTLSPFVSDVLTFNVSFHAVEFSEQQGTEQEHVAFKTVSVRSLRGPPAFIV